MKHQILALFPKFKVSCCGKNDVDWSILLLFSLDMNDAKEQERLQFAIKNKQLGSGNMVLLRYLEGTRLKTVTLCQKSNRKDKKRNANVIMSLGRDIQ